MRIILLILLTIFTFGCNSYNPVEPGVDQAPDLTNTRWESNTSTGAFFNWGYYQLEIARDGSYADVVPVRHGSQETYGYHLNALKFLESSPCSHCVWTSNAFVTSEGNVSVDISIKHPFNNPCFTGFDVRGIIMFPASQRIFDNELRAEAGLGPSDLNHVTWYASSNKGDAELVNREGWTRMWEPEGDYGVWTESGYPIFGYFHGKFASGEHIGNLNPFIRFHSTDTRHMFEVGETVMRTYIIKPPAQGPIEACYAVYAHWAEPDVLPVTNPETDFPLDANSCLPYELEYYQEGIIDPDAPPEIQGEHIRIHMKDWGVIPVKDDFNDWRSLSQTDFVDTPLCVDFQPHPSGQPDEYWPSIFYAYGYYKLPDSYFPGTLPIMYRLAVKDPVGSFGLGVVASDHWIMDIEFGPRDGVW